MAACFPVKEDGPEFSQSIVWAVLRAKNRVANPECQWAARMVRPLKKAFVVTLWLSVVAREIDLLRNSFQCAGHGILLNCNCYQQGHLKSTTNATKESHALATLFDCCCQG